MSYRVAMGGAETTGRPATPISATIQKNKKIDLHAVAPVTAVVLCFRCPHTIEQAVRSVAIEP